jgi:drug/metabolite transporter (DMT)-like permease
MRLRDPKSSSLRPDHPDLELDLDRHQGPARPGSATAVPPVWSVTYRFLIAGVADVRARPVRRSPIASDRRTICSRPARPLQFVHQLQLRSTPRALRHLGLVAVVFALLPSPTRLLALFVFGRRTSRRLRAGSALALVGVAIALPQEIRVSEAAPEAVALGIFFSLVAVLGASAANVMQLSEALRVRPIVPLLGWAMLYGALFDGAYALAFAGPPAFESRIAYWIGLFYLGTVASGVAFALYYRVIRAVGPAQRAYSSVLIPILAMAISTMVEGYRWSMLAAGAACSPSSHGDRAASGSPPALAPAD